MSDQSRHEVCHPVYLTDKQWRCVLYCVKGYEFSPADQRASDIRAEIERQTGCAPLTDAREGE